MKALCTILLLFIIGISYGQSTAIDSIRNRIDSLGQIHQLDSIKQKVAGFQYKIDSLKGSFEQKLVQLRSEVTDSLTFIKKADSLANHYRGAISEEISFLNSYTSKLDPKFGIKQLSMPNMPGMPNVPTLPQANLPTTNLPRIDVGQLKPKIPDVSEVTEKAGIAKSYLEKGRSKVTQGNQIVKDAVEIKENGLNSLNIDSIADKNIGRIAAVQSVQGEIANADKLKQLQQLELEKIKDQQAARDMASSQLSTDKILSKEEAVKSQIEKLSKHKRKFDQLNDMRYVPKFKPNEMKGKPFRDRLAPGTLMNVVKVNDMSNLYLSPELLYRFSGRISAGIGGMYRFRFTPGPSMNWDDPSYGYRAITQVKTVKSIYIRIEWENVSAVTNGISPGDPKVRYWNSGFMPGIGRVQDISYRVKGYFWSFYDFDGGDVHAVAKNIVIKTGLVFNLSRERADRKRHIMKKLETRFHEQKSILAPIQ